MSTKAKIYVALFGLLGTILIVWSSMQLAAAFNAKLFFGLLLLGIVVQGSSSVSKQSNTTFSINHGIHLVTLALIGLPSAIVLGALSTMSAWVLNSVLRRRGWKGSISQLVFNTGMIVVLLAIVHFIFLQLAKVGLTPGGSIPIRVAFWLSIALFTDQLNLFFVSGVVYLTSGVKPAQFWQRHRWLMPMNVIVTSVVGSLLFVSIERIGLAGLLLFCVPMMLTSYSFHLYIQQNQKHVDELELRSAQLEEMNAELEQANRAKDRFLAVLSHDMRTTLTSIRLYSQMLNSGSDKLDDTKKARMLSAILESERTLTGLVDNLLEIEQIEDNGLTKPINSKIDLAQEVAEVATALEIQLVTKNLNLYTKIHQEPLYINADAVMIRKIVQNLISNAIKYTPASGAIHVNLYTNPTDVVMIVEDTGYGIPKDALETIFEPYYRVPSHVDRALGTGLGLSIVKTMVELHGGRIEVASEEGLGSRFTVRLPKNLETAADEALAALDEQTGAMVAEDEFEVGLSPEAMLAVSAETQPQPELP